MKKTIFVIALCLLASVALIFNQISKLGSVKFTTLLESQNTAGMVAAHLLGETNATAGTVHKVVIYPIGQSPEQARVVFLADEVDKLAMSWISPEELHICFGQARIFEFTNFFSANPDIVDTEGRIVIHQDLHHCE